MATFADTRSGGVVRITISDRRLVWLPWHTGSPPLSAPARLQLASGLRRIQRRDRITLPCSRLRFDLGEDMYVSRVHDPPVDREITYRVDVDTIVVVEVLPDRPEFREHTFLVLRRLLDYKARGGRLEESAWLTGNVSEFLQLTPEQYEMIDIRVALAGELERFRIKSDWTQEKVATRLGTSRSRVAMMESADSSVSVDLLMKSLLVLGVSRRQVGRLVLGPGPRQPTPDHKADRS